MHETLPAILLLLVSSVLVVALFRALKLPAMLAYILVGLLLGPKSFGFLPDTEANRQLAEFGIVFLMFSIGLEFSLGQLYAMRRIVLGIGSLQVLITMGAIMLLCLSFDLDWKAALVVSGALTMSSTAIVSKLLVERLDLNARHGRIAIGVLLFQDLAVVPLLVLIPAIASPTGSLAYTLGIAFLKAAVMLSILFFFGKNLMNRWFGIVARQRSRELFVMNVLMVTMVLAYATKVAGLSYALGAFIAGMLISETRFRYQVESDIAAFRDILMGLFFITIGMLLDFNSLVGNLSSILLVMVGLIIFKALVVAMLSRFFRYEPGVAVRAGVTLAQAGEFSFVVFSLGLENDLIGNGVLQIVLAASLLSMFIAPFIIQRNLQIAEFFSRSYTRNRKNQIEGIESVGKQLKDHVIICGFGRSGQYLSRFLKEEKFPFIALDIDPARVQEAASAGENVMYGDAGKRLVLDAAGAARAKALIISYDDPPSAIKILHLVNDYFPNLPVVVRTVDDTNMERFRDAGASEVVPEVLEGSLMLASHALVLLGVPLNRVVKRIRLFREERYKMFKGFFHGISDGDEAVERAVPRLHSVPINALAYCVGKPLKDIYFGLCKAEITAVRRDAHPEEVSPDFVFKEGDVVVILAKPHDLVLAERILLTGKDT
ncbi:monovalent cation:proton antiporter family protein [Candidatus Methylopumilus turicensis]|uniref:Sodium/hydrogen exchanger n=1 Tax=Candidatus Methylopumilus turicensis TaxID=1581680 RepID=A0A0B7IS97_9PROT|nr:monovalent cation:proton antiporter family protein [Candidatus Methylopumilus turicensis]CEN55184.1 Sodium/hydrogen exchanger [Candidatus Methylopumilus turicensis]